MDMPSPPDRHLLYWKKTRRLTLSLLAIWGGVTFAALFFARELSAYTIFGWPLSFYLAAQGLLLGYLLLTGVYVIAMKRLARLTDARGDHAA